MARNEKLTSILRTGREILQRTAEPVDALARVLNGKKNYPPLHLRQRVGNLFDFEGSAGEYLAYLKLLCGLQRGDKLLDVGCGCGLVGLSVSENVPLLQYLGRYKGVDPDVGAIKWCERHLEADNAFFHVSENISSESENSFDVVLCKSLFTHLLPLETTNYLQEIGRVLRPKGTCLATFFLLEDRKAVGRYTFKHEEWPVAYERLARKRAAVAYRTHWLSEVFKDVGFSYNIWYGSWRGDGRGLSFQDIVILQKE